MFKLNFNLIKIINYNFEIKIKILKIWKIFILISV